MIYKIKKIIKKVTLTILGICVSVVILSCNSDVKNYSESTQSVVNWFYDNFGDNEQFEILEISFIDDTESGYIIYSVDFQMVYDSMTDDGEVLGQSTMMYYILSSNDAVVKKFNINDIELYPLLYGYYEDAKLNVENYKYTYSTNEIENMLTVSSKE